MKQLLLLLTVLFTLCANAQNSGTKVSLNEKTVVKDSSGMIYPYSIWQKLLQTGEYGLKPLNVNADPPEFLLMKLSEAEMKARDERMPKPRESAYFRTGSSISNVKLVTLDKKKYNLKDLAGKVVVLNFWFINCSPCRMEIPHLNKMTETYKDRDDVVFLAVALDEAYDLKQFLKEMPFNYGIVDGGRYIASQYGITSYPTHVVLDKEGKVTFHTSGYGMGTVPWLKKSIDAALGSKP
jgi:thiol-disulfide isomerase/thioredoxin